jgi:hypothetical protein
MEVKFGNVSGGLGHMFILYAVRADTAVPQINFPSFSSSSPFFSSFILLQVHPTQQSTVLWTTVAVSLPFRDA